MNTDSNKNACGEPESFSTPLLNAHYMQVIPNSHFWTNLYQIILMYDYKQELTKEYLLIGLKNSLKNGYEIKQISNVDTNNMRYTFFNSIDHMIEYINTEYFNQSDFYNNIKCTVNLGLNLTNGLKMERQEVYKCLDGERDYQDKKWDARNSLNGVPDIEKPVAEWLNYIEFHLEKAKYKNYILDKNEALAELRKVAALAVRCFEIHGCPLRQNENDNGCTGECPCINKCK